MNNNLVYDLVIIIIYIHIEKNFSLAFTNIFIKLNLCISLFYNLIFQLTH